MEGSRINTKLNQNCPNTKCRSDVKKKTLATAIYKFHFEWRGDYNSTLKNKYRKGDFYRTSPSLENERYIFYIIFSIYISICDIYYLFWQITAGVPN